MHVREKQCPAQQAESPTQEVNSNGRGGRGDNQKDRGVGERRSGERGRSERGTDAGIQEGVRSTGQDTGQEGQRPQTRRSVCTHGPARRGNAPRPAGQAALRRRPARSLGGGRSRGRRHAGRQRAARRRCRAGLLPRAQAGRALQMLEPHLRRVRWSVNGHRAGMRHIRTGGLAGSSAGIRRCSAQRPCRRCSKAPKQDPLTA